MEARGGGCASASMAPPARTATLPPSSVTPTPALVYYYVNMIDSILYKAHQTRRNFDVLGNYIVAKNRKAVYFWQLVEYEIKCAEVSSSSCGEKLLHVYNEGI